MQETASPSRCYRSGCSFYFEGAEGKQLFREEEEELTEIVCSETSSEAAESLLSHEYHDTERTVSFMIEPTEIIEYERVPEKDQSNVWFSRNDYFFMQARDRLVVELSNAGKYHETAEHTMRGLEHFLENDDDDNVENTTLIAEALDAVLEEQYRQVVHGLHNPELIAEAYGAVSLLCHKYARLLGQKDELEVLMIRDTDEDLAASLEKKRRQEAAKKASRKQTTRNTTTAASGDNAVKDVKDKSAPISSRANKKKGRSGLFRMLSSAKLLKQKNDRNEIHAVRPASKISTTLTMIEEEKSKEQKTTDPPAPADPVRINNDHVVVPRGRKQGPRKDTRRSSSSSSSKAEMIDSSIGADCFEAGELPNNIAQCCKALMIESSIGSDFVEMPTEVPVAPPIVVVAADPKKKKPGLFRRWSSRRLLQQDESASCL